MINMQAVEKTGIRVIRQLAEDANFSDIMSCVDTAIKAAAEAKNLLSEALFEACSEIDENKDE